MIRLPCYLTGIRLQGCSSNLTGVRLQRQRLPSAMDSAGETVSESEWKVAARNIISNATTRNIIDLLLVLVILVLLTLAAPVIRGDCNHGEWKYF